MKKVFITEKQFKSLINEAPINNIVAYHGSPNKIDKFINDFVGGKEAIDQEGPGIYFTTDEQDASQYGENIYKVTLKPRKLLSDKSLKGITRNDVMKLIKMKGDWKDDAMNWDENPMVGLRMSIDAIFDQNNAKDIITQVYIEYYRYNPIDYVNNAAALGFDGIMLSKDWGAQHIIVYNPNIIEVIK